MGTKQLRVARRDFLFVLAVFTTLGVLLLVIFATEAAAQGRREFTTPWGDPDLQGIWNTQTPVPLERPPELAGKAFFTEEEAAEFARTALNRLADLLADDARIVAGNSPENSLEVLSLEIDKGQVGLNLRTSLIIDPPDGKIPYTPAGRQRWEALPNSGTRQLPANRPEDRDGSERCLTTQGLFIPNGFANNNHLIVQAPGWVVIHTETIHEHRVIPLDGRPHVGSNIRQWTGDSRGRWEGETLVVETTNFNDQRLFRGATRSLHLVERFTRVDAKTIIYRLTVTDPATFATPWTLEQTLRPTDGLLYEHACHEGNYSLANILSAARAAERKGSK